MPPTYGNRSRCVLELLKVLEESLGLHEGPRIHPDEEIQP
jgi:hypothetical protein